jgi:hypothetical protein
VLYSPELWGNSNKIYDFLFLSRLFSIGKQIHPTLPFPPSKGRRKGSVLRSRGSIERWVPLTREPEKGYLN